MSRLVIGSRAALITALRKQVAERGGAAADAAAAALAAGARALAEELFLDALFLVAQFPGGQIAEAAKCCYAFDLRLCAGLCRAAWAEEAFWSGLVRVAHPGREKRTRLMYAAWRGDTARVVWLLARGAPREAKDIFTGWTALHWASTNGHADAMRALLAAGANVEAVAAAFAGWRPLHTATLYGSVTAATLLLDAGADVNALDNRGRSPLSWAKTPAMCALLAARGGMRRG